MFSHDTELSLLVVVDLVNTAPECNGSEGLPDAAERCAALRPTTPRLRRGSTETSTASRPCYRGARATFHALFGADRSGETSHRGSTRSCSQAPVRPRLSDHDGYGWHMHYFAPGASLAEHLAVDGGMAIAQVVSRRARPSGCGSATHPTARPCWSTCPATGRKRYCDARTCGNRMNVAAYRERKRAARPMPLTTSQLSPEARPSVALERRYRPARPKKRGGG